VISGNLLHHRGHRIELEDGRMMVKGRFQIKRISQAGSKFPTYQITHENYQGGEFVGSIEAEHLKDFLRDRMRLAPSSVEGLLDEVELNGHVLIEDAELSENDMAAAGMQHMSPDV
jgi:hypothetical protein